MREVVTAVFYDIENLGCSDRWYEASGWNFKALLAEVDGQKSLGQVRIQRAYLDPTKAGLDKVKADLIRIGCENVDILSKGIGPVKNTADIQLCIDAIEVLLTKDFVSQFVLVSGDGDFFPLARKLHHYGKSVIGVAVNGRINQAFKDLCDAFVVIKSAPNAVDAPPLDANSPNAKVASIKDPIIRRMAKSIDPVPDLTRKRLLAKAREIVAWLWADASCSQFIKAGTLSNDVLFEASKYAMPTFTVDRDRPEYIELWITAMNGSPMKIKSGFIVLRLSPPSERQVLKPTGSQATVNELSAQSETIHPKEPKVDALLAPLEPLKTRMQAYLAQSGTAASQIVSFAGERALEFLVMDSECRVRLASDEGIPVRLLIKALSDSNSAFELEGTGFATRAELLAHLTEATPLKMEILAPTGRKVFRWRVPTLGTPAIGDTLESHIPWEVGTHGVPLGNPLATPTKDLHLPQ